MTQIAIVIDEQSQSTLQVQVYVQIRAMIVDGALQCGSALPSTRELARQLSLSRNTVMLAYARLADEGYVTFRPTRGSFVNSELPDQAIRIDSEYLDNLTQTRSRRKPPTFIGRAHRVTSPNKNIASIDFWPGSPDRSAFPTRQWRRILLEKFDSAGSELTEYSDPAGLPELREAIAAHLGPSRGMRVNPKRIIVVTGTQMALNIVCRLLLEPNAGVVVEDPCYEGAANAFESYRARLIPVAVDKQGLLTDELPARDVSVVYVTPSHQFPLGHPMSLDRRRDLIEWSNATGAYLLEDDYDADFQFTGPPLPALAAMDNGEAVFYLGTFSKALGPGLRIGFMVVPHHLQERAVAVKTLLDHGFPWLEQAVLTKFLVSGEYTSHLRRIRQSYASRLGVLRAALQTHFTDVQIDGDQSGMHVAWRLPPDAQDAQQIADLAIRRGVGAYPVGTCFSRIFNDRDELKRVLIMGYAALKDTYIKEGVSRIAQCISSDTTRYPR